MSVYSSSRDGNSQPTLLPVVHTTKQNLQWYACLIILLVNELPPGQTDSNLLRQSCIFYTFTHHTYSVFSKEDIDQNCHRIQFFSKEDIDQNCQRNRRFLFVRNKRRSLRVDFCFVQMIKLSKRRYGLKKVRRALTNNNNELAPLIAPRLLQCKPYTQSVQWRHFFLLSLHNSHVCVCHQLWENGDKVSV